MSQKVLNAVNAGVVTGDDVQKIFAIAKEEGFAIPGVNVIGTDSINATLEAAKEVMRREDIIDRLVIKNRKRHIQRINTNQYSETSDGFYVDILSNI